MHQQATPLDLSESADLLLYEPVNPQPNESANQHHLEESAAECIAPSYRIPDAILDLITSYYAEQLAIKELQIQEQSNELSKLKKELSKLKKEDQQQNHESGQIRNQYKEEIAKIPEARRAMYIENGREIQFITVLSDIEKALSHEIYVIENTIEKKHPNWSLDFQYIELDEYPEEAMARYSPL